MINLLQNIQPRLVDILMLKCDDNYNEDFDKDIYEECIFRALRKVARIYNVATYIFSFNNIIPIPPDAPSDYLEKEFQSDVNIPLKGFRGEISVTINDVRFTKAENNLIREGRFEYHLYRGTDGWKFNYSPRSQNDTVHIIHQVDIELSAFEDEQSMPVIPNKYEDEIIKFSLINVAEIGMARFKGDKFNKYKNIFGLNQSMGIDPNVTENIDFRIKPLKFP
jgi:hypothetical protein